MNLSSSVFKNKKQTREGNEERHSKISVTFADLLITDLYDLFNAGSPADTKFIHTRYFA
jgi:hypothetical protein